MPKKFTPLTFKNAYPRDVNWHLRKGNVKCLCQKKIVGKKNILLRTHLPLINFAPLI